MRLPIHATPGLRRAAAAVLTVCLLALPTHGQLATDKQPLAWPAALEFSTYRLASGSAVAFRGDYIRSTWDGDLVAYDVNSSGVLTQKWQARNQVPTPDTRKIFTANDSGSGAPFRWASLSAAQQATLGDATKGPKVLDYLRGDTSNEVSATLPGGFRRRFSTLGAVVHSRPHFSGNEVYVGANDGMLHAFDAATGTELFAFVPSMLLSNGKLAALASTMNGDFPYGVDGPMAIGMVGSTKLLVGGLGAGAAGLYALNITDPRPGDEAAAALMLKWQITPASSGFANLGNVMAAPQIVKLNNDKTVVLVPNGLYSTGKVSSLFVIDADTGALLKEVTAGVALSDGTANGLGGIAAVDLDENGTIDVVYAGDLRGVLWKFNFSSSTYPTAATALLTPTTATLRPITAAPSVSRHPHGGLMVNLGTGKAYAAADMNSTDTDYLYGVWDNGAATSDDLVTQTMTTHTVEGNSVRTVTDLPVPYSGAGAKKGWRIALPGGERVLGSALLTDSGRFIVTTSVLGATPGAWLVQTTALTGGALASPFFDLNSDQKVDAADAITVAASTAVPVGKYLGTGAWSQPVLGQISATLDLPYFSQNANQELAVPTIEIIETPLPGGVSKGHFDFDIAYSCNGNKPQNGCGGKSHTHMYDDTNGVVGVHLLRPSEGAYRLSNAVSPGTQFKVLVANTKWSPAAGLKIGNKIAGRAWELPTVDGFIADPATGQPAIFNIDSIKDFIYVLPPDGFKSKDWGTGIERSGLIAGSTGCVQDNDHPSTAWMEGAFTIQVVAVGTTADDVQANTPADAGGYRLKDDVGASQKMLAQYFSFWHQGPCYSFGGWTPTPSEATDGSDGTRPAGSDDPQGNDYYKLIGTSGGGGGGGGGGPSNTRITYNGVEVTVELTFSDSGVRQVLRDTGGQVASDTTSAFGTQQTGPLQLGRQPRTGRMGWKEVVR